MRFLRQSVLGVFLAAVALGLLAYAALLLGGAIEERVSREHPSLEAQERVFAVNLVQAEARRHTPVLQSYGEIAARRTLELRAAVAGRVVALAPQFEDGGTVVRGMVLVQIDPSDMQAAFDRATADLADAQAEIRDADRSHDLARQEQAAAEEQARLRDQSFARQNDLAARGVGTAATVEEAEIAAAGARAAVLARRQVLAQAEARVDQAATKLARAEIALDEARRDLDDTTIEAPFAGTLNETAVVEGGLIAINERLADLVDPADLEVAFRVSTAQYARLLHSDGSLLPVPVKVMLDASASDLSASGTLSRVDAAAGEGQSGRLLFARLEQSVGFRPGDFVTVLVEEPPLEDAIILPASALGADGHVLVLGEGNRLEELPVELLRRQGSDVLVQGPGLHGREVVRQRTPMLGAGIAVRPIRPEASDAALSPVMLDLFDERRARQFALADTRSNMSPADEAHTLAAVAVPRVAATTVARIQVNGAGD